MRTSSIILISLVSMIVLVIPAHAWVAEPTEETGYYYMYDDQSDPPFTEPKLPPMPSFEPIWDDPDVEKFCTYSDYSYQYTMPDSFWYFGVWYEPDDDLWLTDEGYISFDPACEVGDYPNPPIVDPPFPVTDDPNAIIAPLWQDNNCTQTPDPTSETNRVHYKYDTDARKLIIQWYDIQGNGNSHTYDFELTLEFGGQELLEVDECGVLYSGHLIHFLYNTTSDGWDADNGATGFEDQTGTVGITYPAENLADGRVIRIGYRKVIDHDVAADEIIAPAALVEPNTEVDPITVIGNYGNYAESFDVTLNIYDDEETSVYHNVMTLDTMDLNLDTLGPSEWPLWTPEDPEAHYIAELIVTLNVDQCPANDTLLKDVWTSTGVVTETPPSSGFELKVDDLQTIRFSIPYKTGAEIAIYDVNGCKVRTLTDRTYSTGTHTLTWDGLDTEGQIVSQGVYLVRMEAGNWSTTSKVILY